MEGIELKVKELIAVLCKLDGNKEVVLSDSDMYDSYINTIVDDDQVILASRGIGGYVENVVYKSEE